MDAGAIWPAAIGALLQELLWVLSLHKTLGASRQKKLLASRMYWITAALVIIVSGVVAGFWFAGSQWQGRDVVVFGAFLPAVLKQAGQAIAPEHGAQNTPAWSNASAYLGLSG